MYFVINRQKYDRVDNSDEIACPTLYIVGYILCLLDRHADLAARVQSCAVIWGRIS